MEKNYYDLLQPRLFILQNLAAADLCVGLISVLTDIIWKITISWEAGLIACKLIRFSQALVTYASTYVLVALSIDRYDAITHPMNFSGSWRRARWLVVVAWLLSALFSAPILHFYETTETEIYGTQCWIDFDVTWKWQLYMTLVSVTLFVIPAILIAACYIIIVVTIWSKGKEMVPAASTAASGLQPNYDQRSIGLNHKRGSVVSEILVKTKRKIKGKSDPTSSSSSAFARNGSRNSSVNGPLLPSNGNSSSRNNKNRKNGGSRGSLRLRATVSNASAVSNATTVADPEAESRRASSRGLIPKAKVKTVKMTFVIIFVFILCWSPYIVFDLLQVYGCIQDTSTNRAVATFIQSLAPLNSAANPLIYCLFSTNAAQTFCNFLVCCGFVKRRREGGDAGNTGNGRDTGGAGRPGAGSGNVGILRRRGPGGGGYYEANQSSKSGGSSGQNRGRVNVTAAMMHRAVRSTESEGALSNTKSTSLPFDSSLSTGASASSGGGGQVFNSSSAGDNNGVGTVKPGRTASALASAAAKHVQIAEETAVLIGRPMMDDKGSSSAKRTSFTVSAAVSRNAEGTSLVVVSESPEIDRVGNEPSSSVVVANSPEDVEINSSCSEERNPIASHF